MANDLHDAIMNLQTPMDQKIPSDAGAMLAYKLGHRDARHAAAELALTAPVATEQAQAAPCDGDYLRWAAKQGAEVDWNGNGGGIHFTAGDWGRFCDVLRSTPPAATLAAPSAGVTDEQIITAARIASRYPVSDEQIATYLPVWRAFIAALAQPAPVQAGAQQVEGATFGIIDPDYARYYTLIRTTAWQCGYAIGLHGSFTRDLDLIAVPWTSQALPPDLLVKQVEHRTDLRRQEEAFREKPHGRMCWSLLLPGFTDPRWIDLSVIPLAAPVQQDAPAPSMVGDAKGGA